MKRCCNNNSINDAIINLQRIPVELWGRFFEQIDLSFVVLNCTRVCKTWKDAVYIRPLWYYKVTYFYEQLNFGEARQAISNAPFAEQRKWSQYLNDVIKHIDTFLAPLKKEDPHSNDEGHPICLKAIMGLISTSNEVKHISLFRSHIEKIILRLFSLPNFEENISLVRLLLLRFLPHLDANSISNIIYTLNGLIYHSDKNILEAINYEPCNYIRFFRSLFTYCQVVLDITRVLFAVGLLAKRLRGNNQILFAKFFLEIFMNNTNKPDFIKFMNYYRFDSHAKVIRDYLGTICIFLAFPSRDPSYSSFIKENLENITSLIINLCYNQNQFIKAQAMLAMFLLDNKRYSNKDFSNKDFSKVKNDACWDLCSSDDLRARFFESIRWLYFNAAHSKEKPVLRSIISQIINNKLHTLFFPKWIGDEILNRSSTS